MCLLAGLHEIVVGWGPGMSKEKKRKSPLNVGANPEKGQDQGILIERQCMHVLHSAPVQLYYVITLTLSQ